VDYLKSYLRNKSDIGVGLNEFIVSRGGVPPGVCA
jgi:hypothetical protein